MLVDGYCAQQMQRTYLHSDANFGSATLTVLIKKRQFTSLEIEPGCAFGAFEETDEGVRESGLHFDKARYWIWCLCREETGAFHC